MTDGLLGIDIGSVSVHVALVSHGGHVVWARTRASGGEPVRVLVGLLEELQRDEAPGPGPLGLTGGARMLLASRFPGVTSVTEVVALARGAASLAPRVRSVVEIGGHMSRWIALRGDGSGDLEDFALTEMCAAGAGAFLEQQAGRLNMTIEELAEVSARAPRGAAVAGRCAVFAKSDMIHLQQKGTPTEEIAYGLCLALIRNFQSTVLGGRELGLPVAVVGGGALNEGLLRAMSEVLGLAPAELVVPEHPMEAVAVGAALLASDAVKVELEDVRQAVAERAQGGEGIERLPALPDPGTERPMAEPDGDSIPDGQEVYLGIDVGSVSTNLALIDANGTVLDAVYLRTRGRPLDVIHEGLALFAEHHGDRLQVLGVGTTGSGRHLAGWLVGADMVRNEITAQLRSSVDYLPEVDTILEIGGQDSKYIQIHEGHIVDFTMNKICAAGTGSFLEEQAERLGLNIVEEFADRAMAGEAPADLGSRCTVFMDNELVHAISSGVSTEDLTAGLALSVAHNYLDRVVAGRPIGDHVLFQGGTASNRAVVAAFRQILGRPVAVHPYNRVSGALGAALLVVDARQEGELSGDSAFKGFDRCEGQLERSFECPRCSNRCQVNRFRAGEDVFFFGDTCEIYSSRISGRQQAEESDDPLAWMEQLLMRAAGLGQEGEAEFGDPSSAVGIPRSSLCLSLLPIWSAIIEEAGQRPVLSSKSSPKLLAQGLRLNTAETCLPVKMAYGHVHDLAQRGIRTVLFPSVVKSLPRQAGEEPNSTCPYTHHLPFMVQGALDVNLLTPQVDLSAEPGYEVVDPDRLVLELGLTVTRMDGAVQQGILAMQDVRREMQRRGREVLQGDHDRILVVIGKPYNLLDPFLNLGLGRHLQRLGLPYLPMESLPLQDAKLDDHWDDLPWGLNRDYVRAAILIRNNTKLFPIVLSSFGCGPDGFTVKHLDAMLLDRPRLLLEVDEHRAEAGLVTRLEAFADEVDTHIRRRHRRQRATMPSGPVSRGTQGYKRLLVPYFADHAHVFVGALRRTGLNAELLPRPDDEVRRLGEENTSGRECHVYSLVAGDLAKLVRSNQVEDGDALYYPGAISPCLLPQWRDSLIHSLRRLGGKEIAVVTPLAEDMLQTFGVRNLFVFWQGLVAADLLIRASCELRPYEVVPGTVDAIHEQNLAALAEAVASGSVEDAMHEAARRIAKVSVDRSNPRPIVGVAGDIYTRINDFASGGLFKRLEALGCEVWPASTFTDNTDFMNMRNIWSAARGYQVRQTLRLALYEMAKNLHSDRVWSVFSGTVRDRREPTYNQVIEMTSPYVGSESNNLVMLNLAKVIDFAWGGASGVINAICFNCMVGTVSASMLDRMRRDLGGIPMTTLITGGTEGTSGDVRLEAFVHQVRRYWERSQELGR